MNKNKKELYNVNFSYTIQVEAKNKEKAEERASELYIEIDPKLSELGIDVERIKDK